VVIQVQRKQRTYVQPEDQILFQILGQQHGVRPWIPSTMITV
jgi:hypothetical protein